MGGISGKCVVSVLAVAALVMMTASVIDTNGDINGGNENNGEIKKFPCGINGGDNVMATLDTGTGKMTISGTGPMEDMSMYQRPWMGDLNGITSVEVTGNVTTVGDFAFFRCDNLISMTVAEGCDVEICYKAFSECAKIRFATFSKGCEVEIGEKAFALCGNLNLVTFAKGSNVTSVGEFAFNGCENLQSLTIPNSMKTIENDAFRNCGRLISVTFEEGGNGTSIGDRAFMGCYFLLSASIWGKVTSIGNMAFDHCKHLSTIIIGKNVTGISPNAFSSHVFYDGDVKITDMSKLADSTFNASGTEGDRIRMDRVESSPAPPPLPIETTNDDVGMIVGIIFAVVAAVALIGGMVCFALCRK